MLCKFVNCNIILYNWTGDKTGAVSRRAPLFAPLVDMLREPDTPVTPGHSLVSPGVREISR